MFGDNKSVVDSSSTPHATLHKRHQILSFHRVRQAIATGFIKFWHTPGTMQVRIRTQSKKQPRYSEVSFYVPSLGNYAQIGKCHPQILKITCYHLGTIWPGLGWSAGLDPFWTPWCNSFCRDSLAMKNFHPRRNSKGGPVLVTWSRRLT